MKKTLLATTVASLVLVGCGGSGGGSSDGGSSDSGSSVTVLKGRALLSEQSTAQSFSATSVSTLSSTATGIAFYDINFDGKHQSNEPSDQLDESGNYEIALTDSNAQCEGYAPLVVEVYPVTDSNGDVVEDGYTMSVAPTHATTEEDLIAVSPLTSMVWDEIQDEINAMPEVETCSDLIANQALYGEIEADVEAQEKRFAQTYNVTIDELYSDYKASGDQDLEELAELMVVPMQMTYSESDELQEQTSELSYVTYISSVMSTDLSYNEFAVGILSETYPSVSVPLYDESLSRKENLDAQLKAFLDSGNDVTSMTWLKDTYNYSEEDESFFVNVDQLNESLEPTRDLMNFYQRVYGNVHVEGNGAVEINASSVYNSGTNNYDCNYEYKMEYGDQNYSEDFESDGFYPYVKTDSRKVYGYETNQCSGLTESGFDSSGINSWIVESENHATGYKRFNSLDTGPMETVEFTVSQEEYKIEPTTSDLNIQSPYNKGAIEVLRVFNVYPTKDPVVSQYITMRHSDLQDNGDYSEEWTHYQIHHDGTSIQTCTETTDNEYPYEVPVEDALDWGSC